MEHLIDDYTRTDDGWLIHCTCGIQSTGRRQDLALARHIDHTSAGSGSLADELFRERFGASA